MRANICKLTCSILIIHHVLLWYLNPCYVSTMLNDCKHLTTTLQSNFAPPPPPVRANEVTITMSENEQQSMLSLVHTKACRLFGAKLLSESMMTCCLVDPRKNISITFYWKFGSFSFTTKMASKHYHVILVCSFRFIIPVYQVWKRPYTPCSILHKKVRRHWGNWPEHTRSQTETCRLL